MQRWTFLSFRLPTGITTSTNSHPKSTHNPKPTHPSQVEVKPQLHPKTNIQTSYTPSPKHTHMERTLHTRITKLKAHNDQLRHNIAKLESQSAYLRRLKELEKEVNQMRKQGRELALRKEALKLVVERWEEEVEGLYAEEDDGGWVGDDGDQDDGWIGGRGGDDEGEGEGGDGDNGDEARWERTSDEGTFKEGSVRREAEHLKEEQEGRVRVWQLKVEEEGLDGDGGEAEDKREAKQEAKDVANKSFNKWVEEMELVMGAEAWK